MSKNIVNSKCYYESRNESDVRKIGFMEKIIHISRKRNRVKWVIGDQIMGTLKT